MSDIQQIARWMVEAGYPIDYRLGSNPPIALREAVIDEVFLDRDGSLHGNELSRTEVADWLKEEGL